MHAQATRGVWGQNGKVSPRVRVSIRAQEVNLRARALRVEVTPGSVQVCVSSDADLDPYTERFRG